MSHRDARLGRDAAADLPASIGRSDSFQDSLIHQPRGGRARQGWTPVHNEVRPISQRERFFQSFHHQQARALSHTVATVWDQRESRKKGLLQRRQKDFDRQQRPNRRRRLPAAHTLHRGAGSAAQGTPPSPLTGIRVFGAGSTGAATDEPAVRDGPDAYGAARAPATPGRPQPAGASTMASRRGASAAALSSVEGGAAGLTTPPPNAPARIGARLARSVQRARASPGGLSRYQGHEAGFPLPSSELAHSTGEAADTARARATEDIEAALNAIGREAATPASAFLDQCAAQGLAPRPLADLLPQRTGMQRLSAPMLFLGDGYTAALASAVTLMPSLRVLDLRGNRIGPAGAEALCRALSSASARPRELALADNPLQARGAAAVARCVVVCNSFKLLNLERCGLGDEGAVVLGRELARQQSLHVLLAGANRIDLRGARAIGRWLSEGASLRALSVAWNRIHGKGAAALLQGAAESNSLCTLDLSFNHVGSAATAGSLGVRALSDLFARSITLTHLDVSHCGLAEGDGPALAQGLAQNDTLIGLHVAGNAVAVDARGFLIPRSALSLHLGSDLPRRDFTAPGATENSIATQASTSGGSLSASPFAGIARGGERRPGASEAFWTALPGGGGDGAFQLVAPSRMAAVASAYAKRVRRSEVSLSGDQAATDSCCWMCADFKEVTFTYTPGVSGPAGQEVLLCLEQDQWRPDAMRFDPGGEAVPAPATSGADGPVLQLREDWEEEGGEAGAEGGGTFAYPAPSLSRPPPLQRTLRSPVAALRHVVVPPTARDGTRDMARIAPMRKRGKQWAPEPATGSAPCFRRARCVRAGRVQYFFLVDGLRVVAREQRRAASEDALPPAEVLTYHWRTFPADQPPVPFPGKGVAEALERAKAAVGDVQEELASRARVAEAMARAEEAEEEGSRAAAEEDDEEGDSGFLHPLTAKYRRTPAAWRGVRLTHISSKPAPKASSLLRPGTAPSRTSSGRLLLEHERPEPMSEEELKRGPRPDPAWYDPAVHSTVEAPHGPGSRSRTLYVPTEDAMLSTVVSGGALPSLLRGTWEGGANLEEGHLTSPSLCRLFGLGPGVRSLGRAFLQDAERRAALSGAYEDMELNKRAKEAEALRLEEEARRAKEERKGKKGKSKGNGKDKGSKAGRSSGRASPAAPTPRASNEAAGDRASSAGLGRGEAEAESTADGGDAASKVGADEAGGSDAEEGGEGPALPTPAPISSRRLGAEHSAALEAARDAASKARPHIVSSLGGKEVPHKSLEEQERAARQDPAYVWHTRVEHPAEAIARKEAVASMKLRRAAKRLARHGSLRARIRQAGVGGTGAIKGSAKRKGPRTANEGIVGEQPPKLYAPKGDVEGGVDSEEALEATVRKYERHNSSLALGVSPQPAEKAAADSPAGEDAGPAEGGAERVDDTGGGVADPSGDGAPPRRGSDADKSGQGMGTPHSPSLAPRRAPERRPRVQVPQERVVNWRVVLGGESAEQRIDRLTHSAVRPRGLGRVSVADMWTVSKSYLRFAAPDVSSVAAEAFDADWGHSKCAQCLDQAHALQEQDAIMETLRQQYPTILLVYRHYSAASVTPQQAGAWRAEDGSVTRPSSAEGFPNRMDSYSSQQSLSRTTQGPGGSTELEIAVLPPQERPRSGGTVGSRDSAGPPSRLPSGTGLSVRSGEGSASNGRHGDEAGTTLGAVGSSSATMQHGAFLRFVRDCKLVHSRLLSARDASAIFRRVTLSAGDTHKTSNEELVMTRPEFLECLLRVALRRFLAPGRAQESSAARALRRFLSHHFLRFAPRIIPRALRVTALHSEEFDATVHSRMHILLPLFHAYADPEARMVTIGSWEAMLARAQAWSLSPHATVAAARLCFLSSVRCVVDEERTTRHTRANFSEWVEALARFANILQGGTDQEAALAPMEYREEQSSAPLSFAAESSSGHGSEEGSGGSESSSEGEDEGGDRVERWDGGAVTSARSRDAFGFALDEAQVGVGASPQQWRWEEPEGPLPGEQPTASARFAQLLDLAFAGVAATIVEGERCAFHGTEGDPSYRERRPRRPSRREAYRAEPGTMR